MQKSRLFELFMSFPKKEMREIRKFIASPFFNQRKHVLDLFEFLVRARFVKNSLPSKKHAFEFVFSQKKYDDHKLRLSMSLLYKAFEKYLIWRQITKEKSEMKIKLAQAYRTLNLPRHFLKTLADLKTLQERQGYRNADYYQNKYKFYLEEYLFHSEQKRKEETNLQQVQDNLDISYMTSKLRQSCFLLLYQNIYKKEYNFGMLNQMLFYIEQNTLLEIPAISVYYHCYYALVDSKNYEHFVKFKELIFKHQVQFPKDEIRDLFLLATNYCIRLMNQGERQFAKEGLSIYKEGLKSDVLFLNEILSRFTYRNIVAMAIVSHEFDWANTFIENYKNRLEEQYRESTFSFNLAWLEYERKNYNKALTLLSKINFSDLLLNLSAKTMAIKIYYKLEAFDLLYSHLEAMKKFISRKEINIYQKENYLNTIKFTKKLLDLPIFDREVRAKLRKEIKATDAVAEKNWLLDCLSER